MGMYERENMFGDEYDSGVCPWTYVSDSETKRTDGSILRLDPHIVHVCAVEGEEVFQF